MTVYDVRMSGWSSDVCPSDLAAAVRCRTNTGLPRHLTVTAMPSATVAVSNSIDASASTSAAGFIWSMNGQATHAAPMAPTAVVATYRRSEEHTSELQSLMRISYAVFCLKKKKKVNE